MSRIAVPSRGIEMRGLVAVRNGKTHRTGRNHFVDQGMLGLLSLIVSQGSSTTFAFAWDYNNLAKCRLGSDTITPTTHAMTGLVTPIGSGAGTPQDTLSGTVTKGTTTGIWSAAFQFVWNAGTLPNSVSVGEMGFFPRNLYTNTNFGTQLNGADLVDGLASRLSNADTDFVTFQLNNTIPLIVTWTIQFQFV